MVMRAKSVKDLIWLADLETRRITRVSPSAKSMRGHAAKEVMQPGKKGSRGAGEP